MAKNNILKALQPGSSISDFAEGAIFEISVQTESKVITQKLKQLGLKDLATDLDIRLSKQASKALNEISKLARSALKSAVPVRSGLLRNSNIILTPEYFRSGVNYTDHTRTVSIEGSHTPGYKSQVNDALQLALILNSNDFARSRNSRPEGPFEGYDAGDSTAGWIEKAQKSFNRTKKPFLFSKEF